MSLSSALGRVLVFTAVAAGFAALAGPQAAVAVTAGPSCADRVVKSDQGIVVKILFAKNGAVQQYQVLEAQENMEGVNDFRILLERQFGPASVNAPSLKIVSFKKNPAGGMMLPDKALDSCGRTLNFNS